MTRERGFDPDALREKYREERDKRLRPEGMDQYVEIKGEYKHFVDDPYVEPGFTREPLTDEVDVALIGGGFGGLLAGTRLRQAGVEDLRVVEKGGDFGGHMFHTSRWDFGYTGGDANGNLHKLGDKRVGIIGTGASALQCVPHLGADAEHLYVFQRTPSSVDVRDNRPTDPAWATHLKPGWQQQRVDNFQILTAGGFQEEDLINDGWTDVTKRLLSMMLSSDVAEMSPEKVAEAMEMADFAKMEEIRARVDASVEDPATAEALKPYYRQFCKRPCFHDEYLPTFNRPNVTLVDTHGQGVQQITDKGVVVDGVTYELDCLIFATGFEVGTDFSSRSGYDVVGRGGITLSEAHHDGMRSLHGMHMHGFPNCYVMSTYQSGYTVNFPYVIGIQAQHIAYIVSRALREGIHRLEVSEEAEAEWVAAVVEQAERMVDFNESCTPGYYNNEGHANAKTRKNGFYFGGPTEFKELLEAWRAEGRMKGLERR